MSSRTRRIVCIPFSTLHVLLGLLIVGSGLRLASAATLLYDRESSGAALASDPSVLFPSVRSRTLSGDALIFGPGSLIREKLLELPLVGPGVVPTSGTSWVTVTIDARVPTGASVDNDLTVGISDGTDVVGFMRADNSGGSGWWLEAPDASPALSADAAQIGVVGSFPTTFEATFTLDTDTRVDGVLAGTTLSHTFGRVIERGAALRLVLVGGDEYESYAIHSVRVSVVTSVPEPAYAWLLVVVGLSLAGAGGILPRLPLVSPCRGRTPRAGGS